MKFVDIVRIDHFNGFAKYWEVPIRNKTARKGKWVYSPGEQLLMQIMGTKKNSVKIIAEDLGAAAKDAEGGCLAAGERQGGQRSAQGGAGEARGAAAEDGAAPGGGGGAPGDVREASGGDGACGCLRGSAGGLALDVDDDGEVKALSDGLLIIRHLFGFEGDALVSGALGTAANRTDPDEIKAYIESITPSS